jgi:hypothetical protein
MDVDAMELDLLQRRAKELHLYINVHKNASLQDVAEGRTLYVQEERRTWNQERKPATLLKYATQEECWDYLARSTPKQR